MKWETDISNIQDGKEYIRGYALTDLIKEKTFSEVCFLVLKGELPNEKEARMMDALLVAAVDHGAGPPSTTVSRTVASTGNSLHTALAAGVLTMGEKHGGAAEGAATFFQEHVDDGDVEGLVKRLKDEKVRIPGYGHKILQEDHRAIVLFEVARETKVYGDHCAFSEKVRDALNAISSKPLPLNVDGAMGAILSDMGFDSRVTKGFFVMSRIVGLVAHAHEELMGDAGVRRIDEGDVAYGGTSPRSL